MVMLHYPKMTDPAAIAGGIGSKTTVGKDAKTEELAVAITGYAYLIAAFMGQTCTLFTTRLCKWGVSGPFYIL